MIRMGIVIVPDDLSDSFEGRTVGEYQLLIGGDWTDAEGGAYPIINPATEDVVGEAPEATAEDARTAAAAARAAQPAWAATPREERARLLQAVADTVRQRQQ